MSFDLELVANIKEAHRDESSELLKEIWRDHDADCWVPETFEAIRQLLEQRGETLPTLYDRTVQPKYVDIGDFNFLTYVGASIKNHLFALSQVTRAILFVHGLVLLAVASAMVGAVTALTELYYVSVGLILIAVLLNVVARRVTKFTSQVFWQLVLSYIFWLFAITVFLLFTGLGGVLAGSLLGGAVYGYAIRAQYRAVRYAAPSPTELLLLDRRPPIAFLRSFTDDRLPITRWDSDRSSQHGYLNEFVAKTLWAYGPVLAVGDLNLEETLHGPFGIASDDNNWQSTVQNLLKKAGIVVLVIGETPGILWEAELLARKAAWRKLIVVFPPVDDELVIRRRWHRYRLALADNADINLPEYIDFRHGLMLLMDDGNPVVVTAKTRNVRSYRKAFWVVFRRLN